MNNPKNKKMLNDFINHLDKRGSHWGWYLISKECYENFILKCDLKLNENFIIKRFFKLILLGKK